MDKLEKISELIKKRNEIEFEISAIIGRPAALGHIGEYIASQIFNIKLEKSASHKASDGFFQDEPLIGLSVNVKWYAFQEGILDITPRLLPDFFLVLTGLSSGKKHFPENVRPWSIEKVFIFNAHELNEELNLSGIKPGIATSIKNHYWENAEIFPKSKSTIIQLTEHQRRLLELFSWNQSVNT